MFSRRQSSQVQRLAELSEAERLRLALAAAGDVVYDWTPGDGRIAWSGDPSAHLGLGQPSQFESDAGFHALIDQDAAEARLRLVLSPPADGEPFRLEYALKGAGVPVWVEECGVCLAGANGQAERIVGTVRNVTERKTREAHLSWAAGRAPCWGAACSSRRGPQAHRSAGVRPTRRRSRWLRTSPRRWW